VYSACSVVWSIALIHCPGCPASPRDEPFSYRSQRLSLSFGRRNPSVENQRTSKPFNKGLSLAAISAKFFGSYQISHEP
jgi:hypothetical protein